MTSSPAEQFANKEPKRAKPVEGPADTKPAHNSKPHGKGQQKKADSDKANSATNLIVKFLPPSMTSEGLFALFSEHGELESCKVATNKNSGASLGYGFVKFKNEKSARAALKDLNGTFIQGKVLKVTFVDKAKKLTPADAGNPENSESIKSNIYIAGLPHTWTRSELQRFFSNYGPVVNCKVLFDSHGESRNVGFVQFHTTSSAAHTIESVNGTVLPGAAEPAIVKYARDASSVRHCLPEVGETHKRRYHHHKRHPHHHSMPGMMPVEIEGEVPAGEATSEDVADGVFHASSVLSGELMGLPGLGNSVRMPVNMGMGHHHRPMGYYGYPKAHKHGHNHGHNHGHGFNNYHHYYDKTGMMKPKHDNGYFFYPHAHQPLYNPQLLVGGMSQAPVMNVEAYTLPVDVEAYATSETSSLPQEKLE